MNPFTTIACIDDLTRNAFWPAKEFMYDLIRAPIMHATGIDIAKSPRRGQRHNLESGFDPRNFLSLCRVGSGAQDWAPLYLGIPDAAANYLRGHVPEGALIIGYEMPVWLRRALDEGGHAWLDIRLSPLRFASDLYLALGTNRADLYSRLLPHAQRVDEVASEAALMAAQVCHLQRYEDRAGPYDGGWIFVGQTEADASLIAPDGRFARVADHAATLRRLADFGERLFYKPHPSAHGFATAEHRELERIFGRQVPLCDAETYELMAGERPVAFIGLSSGVLQEARWFDKRALSLMPPICKPTFDEQHSPDGYLQMASHVFLSEPMWSAALNPGAPRARPLCHPPRANHLRELHNAWWGYASHTVRHSAFYRELFAMHGGQRETVAGGEAALRALAQACREIEGLRSEVNGLKSSLRALTHQVAAQAA